MAEETTIIEMTPLPTRPPREKKAPTKKGVLNKVRNCRKAEGRDNEWGPEAKARLVAEAAEFGITLNF